jgi:hypothetical protein
MKKTTIELNKDEEIVLNAKSIFINSFIPESPFFEGRETGMDGNFVLTNQRIYFRSKKHLITRDLFKEEFSVYLDEISSVKEKNYFIFLPFFLVFTLYNGNELKFSFGFGRNKPLNAIKQFLKN